jgi:Mn2+/Fe2+ NRAMP family transporter
MLYYAANISTALIAAGIILIPGAPLLSIALNANVLATVLLPVTLVFVILLASDRQLMGGRANTVSLNMAAASIVTFVAGSALRVGSCTCTAKTMPLDVLRCLLKCGRWFP